MLRVGGGTEGGGGGGEGVGTLQSGSSAPLAPGAMRALTAVELHLLVAMLPVDRCAKRALEGLRRGEAEAVEAEAVEAEAVEAEAVGAEAVEAEAVGAEAVDEEQSAVEVRTVPLELGVDSRSAECTVTAKRRLEETREDDGD